MNKDLKWIKDILDKHNLMKDRCPEHLVKFKYYGVMPVCHICYPEYETPKWIPSWRKGKGG